jgi:hypothetical protein
VRLVFCVSYLAAWLDIHPKKTIMMLIYGSGLV